MLCVSASNWHHAESRSSCVKWATGQINVRNQTASAKWVTGRPTFKLRQKLHIAIWNVRRLLNSGKLYMLANESNYYKIFRWGLIKTRHKGIAILVQKNPAKYAYDYPSIIDRLIEMTLDTLTKIPMEQLK